MASMAGDDDQFDVVVIGSGPAGQKAAVQARKAGAKVAVIEQERGVGGSCVYRGTIPSKTLRETALQLSRIKRHGEMAGFRLREGVEVAALMSRLQEVIDGHVRYIGEQLSRNGITRFHGRARFLSPTSVEVTKVTGERQALGTRFVFVAAGSKPRNPPEIPVDHENILDSDSILSMIYLPVSLTILGGGVIACEYASMFAQLGVQVTMVDRADRPLKFMDSELVERFVRALERSGGHYIGNTTVADVRWDGASKVRTRLGTGQSIDSDKLMVALGRVAAVDGLDLRAAGLAVNGRGLIEVDEHCRTKVPSVYAIGDVIGPPSLASTAMEQGRRAARHALELPSGDAPETIPIGIYSIPEMASVGLSEEDVFRREGGPALVGRARFEEIARGIISGIEDGLLKIVADPTGRRVMGVHIVGEGASELIHVAQMALLAGMEVDGFVDNIFNFPTLGEAYRVAALDLIERRPK
jgi:NAD(P) transhydrogenase